MTRYPLQRVGRLLVTKAAVSGPAGVHVVRLLVDTGSVYTILPVKVLESIGCSPASSHEHVRILTGSGYLTLSRLRKHRLTVATSQRKVAVCQLQSLRPLNNKRLL